MILGIGTDLANIERIQGTLDRFGDRFKNRVFTQVEQRKAEARKDVAGTYAKRWAAKEACSKALGTGLAMGISWKDMADQYAQRSAGDGGHGLGGGAFGADDARRSYGSDPLYVDR